MIRQAVATVLIAVAALGAGAGVAAADIPDRGNERDIAKSACGSSDDGVLIDDDAADGSTTCSKKGITTSCDAVECVTIIDDPRLSHRTNGSGASAAHSTS
jgi:hypothetical protein